MIMASPFTFDPEKVLHNARRASDEDLLNRVTAYRAEMEPEAVEIIERELRARGIGAEQIAEFRERQGNIIYSPRGGAMKCSFCHAPAVEQAWGWHRLFGVIPVWPRYLYRCREHAAQ
jgi:hypothetical protein